MADREGLDEPRAVVMLVGGCPQGATGGRVADVGELAVAPGAQDRSMSIPGPRRGSGS
jgi:hypothetical protein